MPPQQQKSGSQAVPTSQAKPLRMAHLVNVVSLPPEHELMRAQPVTFASMRRAQAGTRHEVELLSIGFPEDASMHPSGFRQLPALGRSVLDFAELSPAIRLPLIHDLMQALYEHSDAEYLIFTNVDIALMPAFYDRVGEWIQEGHDAIIVNRRRIPASPSDPDQLESMYAQEGKKHPGFDCFVIHRDLLPHFRLGHVCIGIPFIGILMAQNVFCHARRYHLETQEHLTFHLGMEVFKKREGVYFQHNRTAFWKAIDELWPYLDSRKFPWGNRWMLYRLIRWGLHPSIPIRLALKLEPRRWRAQRSSN